MLVTCVPSMWVLYLTESLMRGSTWRLVRFPSPEGAPTLARLSPGGPQCSVTAPFDDRESICERTRKSAVSLTDRLSITSLDRVPGSRLYLHSFSIFSNLNSIHHLWDITALEGTPKTLPLYYNRLAARSQLLQPWALVMLHQGTMPKASRHS